MHLVGHIRHQLAQVARPMLLRDNGKWLDPTVESGELISWPG
jgi:hypothetical protein